MKKIAFWAALALLVCLALPGLAELPLTLDMTPDTVWAEMVSANEIDALIASAGSLTSETTVYDAEGNPNYTFRYAVNSDFIAMTDSDGATQVATAEGDIYGYDSEAGTYFFVVTPDEAKGKLHDLFTERLIFDWHSVEEHVVAMEELDGDLIVTTYAEEMDVYSRYHVDPATARVERCDEYTEGEDQPMVSSVTVFYGAPVGEPDEQLYEATHGADRTVTLIFDPGTEQESTFTTPVKDGIEAIVIDGVYPGYEHHYADPDCTQPIYGTTTKGDVTFYLKKGL